MTRRKPAPGQCPDLLADVAKLSRFPTRKQRKYGGFDGTSNPRHLRILAMLLRGPMTRETLDGIAGASNGPEEINQLRDLGVDILCFRLGSYDMDARWVFRGLYMLSPKSRPMVARALRSGKGGGQATQGTADKQASTTEAEASHAKS